MDWKSYGDVELELKLWQRVALVPLLLLLIIGVGLISVFLAGGSTLVGLVIGLGMLCLGSFGLLEIGRAGGAPQIPWQEALLVGAVALFVGLAAVSLLSLAP